MRINLPKFLRQQFALVFLVAVLATTFAWRGGLNAGWLWDLANALGYAALAGLLYVSLASPRKSSIRSHQYQSYIILILVIGHAVLIPLFDPVAIEYLKPGAPAYMWSGILALIIIFFLIFASDVRCRNWLHRTNRNFRYWHRVLSWVMVAAVFHHILGSGLYVAHIGQLIALAGLCVLPFLPFADTRLRQLGMLEFCALTAAAVLLFTGIRGWL